MRALHPGIFSAMLWASKPPRLEACSPRTAVGQVLEHQFIHAVSARWDGLDQSAPADDCCKMIGLDIIALQLIENGRFPEFILLANPWIGSQVLGGMVYGFSKHLFPAFKNRNFCRCRAGIDYQDLFFHDFYFAVTAK